MRHVTSLSLSAAQAKQLKVTAKNRGFASVSTYIQHLIAEDHDLISEEELLKEIKRSQKEYKAGKSIYADSIADLL